MEENMAKLDLVAWPATVFVAAPSRREFLGIREKYAQKYPHITFGWWPTIPGSYWVSAFADPSDLERLFSEMISGENQTELPVLVDLEFPIRRSLILKNLHNARANKRKIAEFLANAPRHNVKVYTAEYRATGSVVYALWRLLGLSPSFALPHTKISMCYSSMVPKRFGQWERVKKFEGRFALLHKGRICFELGTIATGVWGNEPILPPQALAQDLQWAKESGVEEVFIFRLGGLDDSYMRVIRGFVGRNSI